MTNASPKVTVITISYNSSRHIEKTIHSILSQDYRDFELLVVDDDSKDNTWQIIDQFKHYQHVRLVRNERNLGEYANRNFAVTLALGEYILFIDGDDLLYKHGLETMVKYVERFPQADLAIARPWNEQILYPYLMTGKEFFLFDLIGKGVVGVNFCHLLFKRSALLRVGGFDVNYRCGDTEVQYRLALDGLLLLIPDGLAWWRRTPGQASEKLLKNGLCDRQLFLLKLDLINKNAFSFNEQDLSIAKSNLIGSFLRGLLYSCLRCDYTKVSVLSTAIKHINLMDFTYIIKKRRCIYPSNSPLSPLSSADV